MFQSCKNARFIIKFALLLYYKSCKLSNKTINMLIPNKLFDGCYTGNVVKNNTKIQLGKKCMVLINKKLNNKPNFKDFID